jgi:FlaA1/EpsC-like NDP-sugar epimerase
MRAPLVNSKTLPEHAPDCVLVTGAGGFIGAALATRLVAQSAKRSPFFVFLDNSEQNLHALDVSLQERANARYAAILGDVCDAQLLEEIFARHRPTSIFHAAACKHVPLMERNPLAAMRTNAIGTWQLVNIAIRSEAKELLLVSTDKAVKPASMMGATKRVAEMALQRLREQKIQLRTVRLGNVLGSHGSVSPLFARQIAQGGPVTVTHPEAERYFFTLDETEDLILGATAFDSGTFIPAARPALKISELAERMIAESHRLFEREVALRFTGLRPGDKLREVFLEEEETPSPTANENLLRVCGPGLNDAAFDGAMRSLQDAVERRSIETAVDVIRRMVATYTPSDVILEMIGERSVVQA